MDEQRVGLPDNLDRVRPRAPLARGGERQGLVGGEHGHDSHGHAVLVLFRKGGDNMKAVAFDSAVGDSGHIAEVDDLALEGLQPLGVGRADGRQRERRSKVVWRIVILVSSFKCIYSLLVTRIYACLPRMQVGCGALRSHLCVKALSLTAAIVIARPILLSGR